MIECSASNNEHGARSSIGRAPPCGGGGCGFESRRAPHANVAQLVEHLVANEKVAGSSPVIRSEREGREGKLPPLSHILHVSAACFKITMGGRN